MWRLVFGAIDKPRLMGVLPAGGFLYKCFFFLPIGWLTKSPIPPFFKEPGNSIDCIILLMVQKSCTSWYGKYPVIYRAFNIPGGWPFLNHQQYLIIYIYIQLHIYVYITIYIYIYLPQYLGVIWLFLSCFRRSQIFNCSIIINSSNDLELPPPSNSHLFRFPSLVQARSLHCSMSTNVYMLQNGKWK